MENKRTKILLAVLILAVLIGIPVIKNNLGIGGDVVIENEAQYDSVTSILSRVQAITLDTTVLRSAEFTYLSDFTINLPKLPVGRTNPFGAF